MNRWSGAIGCILALASMMALGSSPEVTDQLNDAIQMFNDHRYVEAAAALARLLEAHPDEYYGYSTYWDALARTKGQEAAEGAIREALGLFQAAPEALRSEDYYFAYARGAELLGDSKRKEAITAEAVRHFPRGQMAQKARLNEARDIEDPIRAAALFQRYIDDFPEAVSWRMRAAEQRFEVMVQHANRFSVGEVVDAADQRVGLTEQFVQQFGNVARLVVTYRNVSESFLDVAPEQSLRFAEAGVACVKRLVTNTDEFDSTAAVPFHAIQLGASIRLKRWDHAVSAGRETGLDKRSQLTLPPDVPWDEAELRVMYARALEETGDISPAAEQLAYAARLSEIYQPTVDQFLARHEQLRARRGDLEVGANDFAEQRGKAAKAEVLASQLNLVAPPFSLEDLSGRTVSLSGLAGRVVVVTFWATWCGPCVAELKALDELHNELHKADSGVAFVAISTDAVKDAVAPFVARQGLALTVLYSDGSVESQYELGPSLPHLFVIDANGRIRFHEVGFDRTQYKLRVQWMIEAASTPTSQTPPGGATPQGARDL